MNMDSILLAQKMLSVISFFLVLIAVVAFCKKIGVLKEKYVRPANFAVINITLPALIFVVIIKSELKMSLLTISLAAFAVFALILFLSAIIGSRLGLKRTEYGSLLLAASLGNTAYFGYPVVLETFGQDKLINAVFYDYSIGILLYTAGIYICQRFGTADKTLSVSSTLLGVFKFPAFIIAIPAVLLKNIDLPVFFINLVDIIGRMTVPLVLLTIGLSFKFHSLNQNKILIAVIAILKLAVSPLLAVIIGKFLRFTPDMLSVTMVQAGMPTAMMTVVLGQRYKLETGFLATVVLITTMLSAITLPLLMFIVF